MRLRLIQTGGKLGAVLVDGVSLSDAVPKGRLSDGLKLAVTPTQEPEQFTAAHRLVRVQRWIPATMRLVPNPREIAVEEAVTTVSELQQTLARFVGDECPPGAIHVMKPFAFQLRDTQAIPVLWHTKPQPSAVSFVTAAGLNAAAGDLILYKDSRDPEQVEPPAVEEGGESGGGGGGGAGRVEAPGFRILSPEEQLERERVQAEQRPSGQFAADMEERMAVLKAAGVTSAHESAAMARTNSV